MDIRQAVVADYDAVAAVWLAGWQASGLGGVGDPTVADLRDRIDDELADDWRLHVASVDGDVVGMLATYDSTLDQLFLAPAWRGRGIGAALLAQAKELMPGGFMLWTQRSNAPARRFYEAWGLVLAGYGQREGEPVAHYRWG